VTTFWLCGYAIQVLEEKEALETLSLWNDVLPKQAKNEVPSVSDAMHFRSPQVAQTIAQKIRNIAPKKEQVKICHVCGTHEWTITHFGLRSLLPENVEVIAGPGCPVCIVPAAEVDEAVQLAKQGKVLTCFGDLLRVPGSESSLLQARAEGADVRIVYSVSDAIQMAKQERDKEFVFHAVGFETTAPITALEALGDLPENFSFWFLIGLSHQPWSCCLA
jgi:hydrogenase expression/formation protein HypD